MTQIKFPFDQLQLAIHGRLTTDITSTDIFDYPADASIQGYPYIVIGDYSSEEEGTKLKRGQLVTSEIHVYSEEDGMKEVNDLMDEIAQSLSRVDLTLTGFEKPLEISIEGEVRRDFDLGTPIRHGIVRAVYQIYPD